MLNGMVREINIGMKPQPVLRLAGCKEEMVLTKAFPFLASGSFRPKQAGSSRLRGKLVRPRPKGLSLCRPLIEGLGRKLYAILTHG